MDGLRTSVRAPLDLAIQAFLHSTCLLLILQSLFNQAAAPVCKIHHSGVSVRLCLKRMLRVSLSDFCTCIGLRYLLRLILSVEEDLGFETKTVGLACRGNAARSPRFLVENHWRSLRRTSFRLSH